MENMENENKNKLQKQIALAEKRAYKSEPSIKEANITFLCLTVLTALMLPFSLLFVSRISPNASIGFAVTGFVLALIVFLIGKISKNFRAFNYLSLTLSAVALSFCIAAVYTKLNPQVLIGNLIYITGGIIFACALNFIFLFNKNSERSAAGFFILVFFVMMSTGIALMAKKNYQYGIPLLFMGMAMTFLYSAFFIYLKNGESFFTFMALCYFIVVVIAGIIALLAISGGDGCDCDCGGDCGDCGKSPRKNRHNRINPIPPKE